MVETWGAGHRQRCLRLQGPDQSRIWVYETRTFAELFEGQQSSRY